MRVLHISFCFCGRFEGSHEQIPRLANTKMDNNISVVHAFENEMKDDLGFSNNRNSV